MEEKSKITEQEQNLLNNLYIVFANHNIPKYLYVIGEEHQDSEQIKFCLIKTPLGNWNTFLKLNRGVFESTFHQSLPTAIIRFIQWVEQDDEKAILMIKEFLNLSNELLMTKNSVKSLRRKR